MNFATTVLATFLGAFLALLTYTVLTGKAWVILKSVKDAFDVFDPSVDGFASMQLQGFPSDTVAFMRPAHTRKHMK